MADGSQSLGKQYNESYLHLLVPATSSNQNFCKLMLSVTALAYPSPTMINWGDEEMDDPYINHVNKVDGILRYLRNLAVERQDDLVLIVDGYDVWFQLRPDIVISRYYDIISTQNRQLVTRFGPSAAKKHNIYQSIIFGPDKICWPENIRRPACWAPPHSPLPRYAFGPHTDSGKFRDHYRPRWLNSGTIIGPVGDLIKMFEAAHDEIVNSMSDIVSDQFHLANILGKQEVARKLRGGEKLQALQRNVWISDGMHGEGHYDDVELDIPDLDLKEDYEFHITIDHESKLFQTTAYYWKYLGWYTYDQSSHDGELTADELNAANVTEMTSFNRQMHFELPQDLLSSPPPFSGSEDFGSPPTLEGKDPSRDPRATGLKPQGKVDWADVRLGTNIVTRQVFPIVHITPPKEWLEIWWHDMWFFPYGEAIIKNTRNTKNHHILRTPDKRNWWMWDPKLEFAKPSEHLAAVAADDQGVWHGWDELCHEHEDTVFFNARKPGA